MESQALVLILLHFLKQNSTIAKFPNFLRNLKVKRIFINLKVHLNLTFLKQHQGKRGVPLWFNSENFLLITCHVAKRLALAATTPELSL